MSIKQNTTKPLGFRVVFFLRMRLRPIVGQPGNSIIISRVKLGQTTVQLRKRAGFDDVGHRLGLTTGAQISVVSRVVF